MGGQSDGYGNTIECGRQLSLHLFLGASLQSLEWLNSEGGVLYIAQRTHLEAIT